MPEEHTSHTPSEIMDNYLLAINLVEQTLQGEENEVFSELKKAGVTDKDLVEGLMVLSVALAQNVAKGNGTSVPIILDILRNRALAAGTENN